MGTVVPLDPMGLVQTDLSFRHRPAAPTRKVKVLVRRASDGFPLVFSPHATWANLKGCRMDGKSQGGTRPLILLPNDGQSAPIERDAT